MPVIVQYFFMAVRWMNIGGCGGVIRTGNLIISQLVSTTAKFLSKATFKEKKLILASGFCRWISGETGG